MADDSVRAVAPLGTPWETADPFLFCMHHDDRYPAGDERLGPAASLAGRELGQDFAGKDGWRMYHGRTVPGFPQHPHRGFETVTIVRQGFVDHSDSLGATARFGPGDVQWLTAGRGIAHSEMFPLLERAAQNPLEIFQIWLNLPPDEKLVEPHFSMLWRDRVPRVVERDSRGRAVEVTLVAGRLGEQATPPSPPHSWAARADSGVAIWTVHLDAGATWTLPAGPPTSTRTLYLFRGSAISAGGRPVPPGHRAQLSAGAVTLEAGAEPAELLFLQGRPIGAPVAQLGPFVMNDPAEIRQALADYQRTGFGGWPWGDEGPVHPPAEGRFARRPDGQIERP